MDLKIRTQDILVDVRGSLERPYATICTGCGEEVEDRSSWGESPRYHTLADCLGILQKRLAKLG